jgi:DNA mismatch repair protein MutS
VGRTFQMKILIKEYEHLKKDYPAAILLFRVGAAYLAINEDAKLVSQILGIHLLDTQPEKGNTIYYTVFPDHALDSYMHRLVKAGFQVAVCEELNLPDAKSYQPTLF